VNSRSIVLTAASLVVTASCNGGEPVCAYAGLYDDTHAYVSTFESDAPVPVPIEPISHQDYAPVSLSPDGSKLAYFVDGDRSVLHVTDLSGNHRRFQLGADDPNSGGSRWENAHVVRVERGWRLMSEFNFYRLSETGESAQRLRDSYAGDDCSLSSDSKHVACVQGTTALVDEVEIFKIPISTYSSYVGSFTLRLGRSVSSQLVPGATLKLEGYGSGTAHLSYETDGVEPSPETWERSGSFFPLNTNAGDYLLSPEFKPGDRQIRMRVRKPDDSLGHASSAIAWSDDGTRLTMVWGMYAATLKREGKSRWTLESKGFLAFDIKAKSMRYASPNLLVIDNGTSHFVLDTRSYTVLPSTVTPVELPKTMDATTLPRPIAVADVVCHQ